MELAPNIGMIKSTIIFCILRTISCRGKFSLEVVIAGCESILKPTVPLTHFNGSVIFRGVKATGQAADHPPYSRIQKRADHSVLNNPIHNTTANELIPRFATLDPSV